MAVDFHAEDTLPARIQGYLSAGPDKVGGPGARGRWKEVVDSDDLLDLAVMARETGGPLGDDFRPVLVAFVSEVLGNMRSAPERWHGAFASAGDILAGMEAAARAAGVPFAGDAPPWVAPACLAWDGSPDSPMDTLLAFGDHARVSFSMETLHGVGDHCMAYPGMHVVVPVARPMAGRPAVTEMALRSHLDGAGSREGLDRWGRPAVRMSWDADGIRFELNAATAEGMVLAEALAGPVFPFHRELGRARDNLAMGWFAGSAMPTLRGYVADMDDGRGRLAHGLVGASDLDARITPRDAYSCWLVAVRLAGAAIDPGTGRVRGWARVGEDVARHFVDAIHDRFVHVSRAVA